MSLPSFFSFLSPPRPLYEHRWNWFEGAQAEGVDNLVKTLLKFAQEIDTGTISCVNFEVPGSDDSEPALQMLCQRDEQIVVALFHGAPVGHGGPEAEQDREQEQEQEQQEQEQQEQQEPSLHLPPHR